MKDINQSETIPETSADIRDAINTIAEEELRRETREAVERIHAAAMAVIPPDQRTPAPTPPDPLPEHIQARAEAIHANPNPEHVHQVWALATHRGTGLHHTSLHWGEFGNQWFTEAVRRHIS